jgi:acetyl-CoA carboxylase biotin carboxyl carrier protein
MTRGTTGNKEPFNLDTLRELVELMDKFDLTEVSLSHGEQKWRLRRGSQQAPVLMGAPQAFASPMPAMQPAGAQAPTAAAAAPAAEADDKLLKIVSPTVGTYYESPSPDDPPFVKVGSKVEPSTIVCIVEAMKVFNQIPAEMSGTVVEILVKNGDSVEFGQPLFKVRPG